MHDAFKAFKIGIVPIGLQECRVGSFVHVSQSRNLVFAVFGGCVEKTAQTEVNPVHTRRVYPQFIIKWIERVLRQSKIMVCKIGKQDRAGIREIDRA